MIKVRKLRQKGYVITLLPAVFRRILKFRMRGIAGSREFHVIKTENLSPKKSCNQPAACYIVSFPLQLFSAVFLDNHLVAKIKLVLVLDHLRTME